MRPFRNAVFDQFMASLALLVMSEHWTWWSEWPVRATAADVCGIRRASLALFCFGCCSYLLSFVAMLAKWVWNFNGETLARLKKKYES